LQWLGLYYNAIAEIPELQRLSWHPQLSVLDMRLNPVTRGGPRYRLNVLRASASLKVLDEREVSGLERHRAGAFATSAPGAGDMDSADAVELPLEMGSELLTLHAEPEVHREGEDHPGERHSREMATGSAPDGAFEFPDGAARATFSGAALQSVEVLRALPYQLHACVFVASARLRLALSESERQTLQAAHRL